MKLFVMDRIRLCRVIFKHIKNPFGAILFRLNLIKEYECRFKNNESILINESLINESRVLGCIIQSLVFTNQFDVEGFKKFLKQYNQEIVNVGSVKYHNEHKFSFFGIADDFFGNDYYVEETNGGGVSHVIVDVGASVADSSLYFASKGYKVIAFEPLTEVYNLAKENINLNPHLKDNITLVKKAVSDKKGKLTIYYDSIEETGSASSFTSGTKFQEEVDVTTITDILEEHNISNPYLLKMDCEGAESDIILNTDLSMFEKIYLEYHTIFNNVKWQVLVDKLEKEGFQLDKRVGNSESGIVHLSRK